MIVMIDNYDSFTFNIVQYLGELGAEVVTHRNDAISVAEIEALSPSHLVISPGPCTPNEAGISMEAVRHFAGRLPILGICWGISHRPGVWRRGAARAQVMHGKTSRIRHDGRGVFAGLEDPLEVTRYHSLVVAREGLPECLEVTAWTDEDDVTPGLIMGLRHRELDIEGVQFHPESILTRQATSFWPTFSSVAECCHSQRRRRPCRCGKPSVPDAPREPELRPDPCVDARYHDGRGQRCQIAAFLMGMAMKASLPRRSALPPR